MSNSIDENTDWIATWILNDPEYYDHAVRLANEGSAYALGDWLIRQLRAAPENTGAYHTNREMSEHDWKWVDWEEIRDVLTNV